jgi:hypothetical protein
VIKLDCPTARRTVFEKLARLSPQRTARPPNNSMAIFGWDSIRQAEIYTRAAEQKRMAADAMHLIEAGPVFSGSGTFAPEGQ